MPLFLASLPTGLWLSRRSKGTRNAPGSWHWSCRCNGYAGIETRQVGRRQINERVAQKGCMRNKIVGIRMEKNCQWSSIIWILERWKLCVFDFIYHSIIVWYHTKKRNYRHLWSSLLLYLGINLDFCVYHTAMASHCRWRPICCFSCRIVLQ